MGEAIILTGRVFGRLTVLDLADKTFHGEIRWRCRCACGRIIEVRGDALRRSRQKSCGCLRGELARDRMLARRKG
jgi:hypothetical protein